jgi:uncharacterized protein YciW
LTPENRFEATRRLETKLLGDKRFRRVTQYIENLVLKPTDVTSAITLKQSV